MLRPTWFPLMNRNGGIPLDMKSSHAMYRAGGTVSPGTGRVAKTAETELELEEEEEDFSLMISARRMWKEVRSEWEERDSGVKRGGEEEEEEEASAEARAYFLNVK